MSDVAKLVTETSGGLSGLIYVSHRSEDEVNGIGMPSWVSKWQRKQDLSQDHLPFNFNNLAASGKTTWDSSLSSGGEVTTLPVTGFRLGTVTDVTGIYTHEALEDHSTLLDLLRAAQQLSGDCDTSVGVLEQTLIAGHDHKRRPIGPESSRDGFAFLMRHLAFAQSIPELTSQSDDPVIIQSGEYREAMDRWTRNRRFFKTDTDCIGLGPKMLKRGDIMVVLFGAPVPMTLRATGTPGRFSYVGDVYSQTIMFGEALEAHRAESGADEMFMLV
jgi:hypothetical protein